LEVWEAASSRIITNAHRINEGHMPEWEARDSDFYFVERDTPEAISETLLKMVRERIPGKFGFDPIRDVQVLCPMNRGSLGVRELNLQLQNALNPFQQNKPFVEKYGWQFRLGDKVIQTENNYDKEVFNGDIGIVTKIDPVEQEVVIRFDQRDVVYDLGELDEVSLAYAITIHKSQRNLVYTGITRVKKLVVLVGQKKAVAMAVRNNKTERRFSGLLARLTEGRG
jgi:exodeoxyribonuclease V alpha subunit